MKIIMETEKKESLTLGELAAGDVCSVTRGENEIFAIVTNLSLEYGKKTLIDIETGRTFTFDSNERVKPLEKAEFHPYGTKFNA